MWVIPQFITDTSNSLSTTVPDFRATFAQGHLHVTELPQPFVRDITANDGSTTVLRIVVDTTATTTPAIETYKTNEASVILVTADGFSNYESGRDRIQTQSWHNITNTSTVSRADVLSVVQKLAGTVGYFIAPVVIVFFYIVGMVVTLFGSLIVSLLVWLVALVLKRSWTFGQVFVISLFAVTAPMIVDLLLSVIGVSIPFVFSILLGVYMLVAILRQPIHTHDVPPPLVPPTNP